MNKTIVIIIAMLILIVGTASADVGDKGIRINEE